MLKKYWWAIKKQEPLSNLELIKYLVNKRVLFKVTTKYCTEVECFTRYFIVNPTSFEEYSWGLLVFGHIKEFEDDYFKWSGGCYGFTIYDIKKVVEL